MKATATQPKRDKASTAATPAAEAESPAILAARAARESVRALIEAEIVRQGVFPVARRTLHLIAEAAVMPSQAPPFYRVVDRAGTPRQGANGPMTLPELFDELRGRHGALFVPVPEKPAVEEPPESSASDEIKAATARFVETQSALARTVIARSSARGRAAAASLSGAWTRTLGSVRSRFGESGRPGSGPDAAPPSASPPTAARPGPPFGGMARRTLGVARARLAALAGGTAASSLGGSPAFGASRARDGRFAGLPARVGDGLRRLRANDTGILTRPSTLAGAGLVGALALVLILANRGGEESASVPPAAEPQQEARATPPTQEAPATPPSTLKNPRETAGPTPPPGIPAEEPSPPSADEAPARVPEPTNAIAGKAEVIDTATLRVGGKLVRLFGVEWVRGGQPEELTRYLAGRPVTCQPVAGSPAYLCGVEGRDLSEVVLFNGGGRASSEATPDLVAAEDRARTERLGVWAR